MDDSRRTAAEHRAILNRVLDTLVPASPERGLPGAGELDLAGEVEHSLAAMPALAEMVAQSVAALASLAVRRHDRPFAELPPDTQAELIRDLDATPDAVPPILALHLYTAYYRHPRVLAALGLAPRPPHPEGYEMEPDDLSLLDPVRRRGPLFRS